MDIAYRKNRKNKEDSAAYLRLNKPTVVNANGTTSSASTTSLTGGMVAGGGSPYPNTNGTYTASSVSSVLTPPQSPPGMSVVGLSPIANVGVSIQQQQQQRIAELQAQLAQAQEQLAQADEALGPQDLEALRKEFKFKRFFTYQRILANLYYETINKFSCPELTGSVFYQKLISGIDPVKSGSSSSSDSEEESIETYQVFVGYCGPKAKLEDLTELERANFLEILILVEKQKDDLDEVYKYGGVALLKAEGYFGELDTEQQKRDLLQVIGDLLYLCKLNDEDMQCAEFLNMIFESLYRNTWAEGVDKDTFPLDRLRTSLTKAINLGRSVSLIEASAVSGELPTVNSFVPAGAVQGSSSLLITTPRRQQLNAASHQVAQAQSPALNGYFEVLARINSSCTRLVIAKSLGHILNEDSIKDGVEIRQLHDEINILVNTLPDELLKKVPRGNADDVNLLQASIDSALENTEADRYLVLANNLADFCEFAEKFWQNGHGQNDFIR
jgi:hypothetical protein